MFRTVLSLTIFAGVAFAADWNIATPIQHAVVIISPYAKPGSLRVAQVSQNV